MLEAVLAKCIKHYLKEYLKPVSPDQMKLDIMKGKIKLKDIELLSTAFAFHHIPFLIRKGTVKLIKVIFPWNNLKNEACEVYIEDIFMVLQFDSDIIIKGDIQADQTGLHVKSYGDEAPLEDKRNTLQGLFESVIDNLKVNIKNIHIRIEFPTEPYPICIGVVLPSLFIQTVDENNQPIAKKKEDKFVRKQLLINDFSIYFDTLSEQVNVDNFYETMQKKMFSDHQYLFNPTVFECILIHTKDKTQEITNKIEIFIKDINLCLDFHQCRSILQLNLIWSRFAKRRKYVSCMRPSDFRMFNEVWLYAHKCAILKNRQHVFKPDLGLTILKNKANYIEIYKQAKVSKLSSALLGSPKQKLEALEKKIGKAATVYLRELAEAIFIKEQSVVENEDLNAFDLSEIKKLFDSTELVFSMRQLSAKIQIKTLNLKLNYDKDSPLFAVSFDDLDANFISLPNGVFMSANINDVAMLSYIHNSPIHILRKEKSNLQTNINIEKDNMGNLPQLSKSQNTNINETEHNTFIDNQENKFIYINCKIPSTGEVSSLECSLAPTNLTLDTETIHHILEFFVVDRGRTSVQGRSTRIMRKDIGEQLQFFKKLKNFKVSLKIEKMLYNFPFNFDDGTSKTITFFLSNVNITKTLNELIPKSVQEIPMFFDITLNLSGTVETFQLFSTNDIKINVQLTLINGKFGVILNSKIDLSSLNVFIAQETYEIMTNVTNSLLEIPFSHDIQSNSTQQVLMAGRSKLTCDFTLGEFNVVLNDMNETNEMKVGIAGLTGSLSYFIGEFHFESILKVLRIEQYSFAFLEILGKINLCLDKKSDSEPMIVDATIINLHGFMNFDTIDWIMDFSNTLIKNIPSKVEEPQTEHQEDYQRNEQPSILYLSSSLLNKSVESFVNSTDPSARLQLRKRSRGPSVLLEDDNDTDDDFSDDSTMIQTTKMELNISMFNIVFEMIDEECNSLFEFESITISNSDSTSENNENESNVDPGMNIAITNFSISRDNRFVLKPVSINIPVDLPNPISVSVDYAESELFWGDINSLNLNSPRIFKLMFGGPTPLIKSPISVNAFAKKGFGSIITSTHDIVANATINDVYLHIDILPDKLIVDVKTGRCDGSFPDNFQFLQTYGDFHCNYEGTMNDQAVLVSVPKAVISLKRDILKWVIGFIPTDLPDMSTLQPLRITLDIEPGTVNFYSDFENLSNTNFELYSSIKDQPISIYDNKTLSIYLGNVQCTAFRDKLLELNLKMDGINILSDIFAKEVFRMGTFTFKMDQRLMKTQIPNIQLSLSIDFMLLLFNEVSSLIPENTPSLGPFSMPKIGADLEISNIDISFFTLSASALLLNIPNIKFIYNSCHKVSGLGIDLLTLLIVVKNSEPSSALIINNLEAIIGFSGDSSENISNYSLEFIRKMDHYNSKDIPLNNLQLQYKTGSIVMNYTHLLAETLIELFADDRLLSLMPSNIKGLTKDITINAKVQCNIEDIEINFIIVETFCTFRCSGIYIQTDKDLEAKIKDLVIIPVNSQIQHRSLLSKINQDDNILSISLKNMSLYEFSVFLADSEFFIDYRLLFTLAQFLWAAPFVKFKKTKEIRRSSTDDEKSLESIISFPLSLLLNASNLKISIPTSLEIDGLPELQIDLSAILEIKYDSFSLSLRDISVSFFDSSRQFKFPPILSKLNIQFLMCLLKNFSFSINIYILCMNLAISSPDIFLFLQISQSIQSTMNSIIFAFEEDSKKSIPIQISSITLMTEKIVFILCKDNRSTSKYTPIFRLTIPPIYFDLQKQLDPSKSQPVDIDIAPYIEYFNEVSGNFDMVVEPLKLHLRLNITNEAMKAFLICNNDLNINMPLNAIISIKSVIQDIQESINQKALTFSELPKLWIENDLGLKAAFSVEDNTFVLDNSDIIPVFGASLSSSINISFIQENNETFEYSIFPLLFNYPTYINSSIVVSKKPYKGGVIVLFQRSFQIENNLNFQIELFQYDIKKKDFNFVSTINPGKRYPLICEKDIDIMLSGKGASNYLNSKKILKLSLNDKSTQTFSIPCKSQSQSTKCVKTVYDDSSVAARIVSIYSQYVLSNFLPYPLYFKYSLNDFFIQKLDRGESTNIDISENSNTFSSFMSFNSKLFGTKKTDIKIDFKGPKLANVYNLKKGDFEPCAIYFYYEKSTLQTIAKIYSPIALFNTTNLDLIVESKNGGSNKEFVEVPAKGNKLWCPSSAFDSNDTLNITIALKNNPSCKSHPLDCYLSSKENIFLQNSSLQPRNNDTNSALYVPLKCNISNHDETSIITVSSFLTVVNDLDYQIYLQPITTIQSSLKERDIIMFGGVKRSNRLSNAIDAPIIFSPKSEKTIPLMTKNGTFSIYIDGYTTSPSLSLIEPQKTVFRVQNQHSYTIIELQVIDTGMGLKAVFKPAKFPTPILINNQIDDTIVMAFQISCLIPFEVKPNSTSLFAFDEPFAYPEVTLTFGAKKHYSFRISLVEDTEAIDMNQDYNGKPIFVKVKHNKYGCKIVKIYQRSRFKRQKPVIFSFKFECHINKIVASIIERQMREFVLISLQKLFIETSFDKKFISLMMKLHNFQIDDQNPLTEKAPIVFGRNNGDIPFLEMNCLCPSDSKPFTMFDYMQINFQRIDINVDKSFISDCIKLATSIDVSTVHPIEPARTTSSSPGLVTFGWLEITPPFILLNYNRKTKRPPLFDHIPFYFKFIPQIKSGKMLLPGILIMHLTDRIESIFGKIAGDYKSQVFTQALKLLSAKGPILKGIIAPLFASKLKLSSKSELTSYENLSEPSKLSILAKGEGVYDNYKNVSGCFSQNSLLLLITKIMEHQMNVSPLISKALENKETGLLFKMIPGFGYGHGIVGVLTKPLNDTLSKIQVMEGATRQREPRAFPDYKISQFNFSLANAQNIIFKKCGLKEKIKTTSISKKDKNIILISESSLYLFSADYQELLMEIKITDIARIKSDDKDLIIIMKNGKQVQLLFSSNGALNFFISQFRMIKIFNESLIL